MAISGKQFRWLKKAIQLALPAAKKERKLLPAPQTWYHGTTRSFKDFEIQPKTHVLGQPEFGHYFAEKAGYAQQYVKGTPFAVGAINLARPGTSGYRKGANIRPVKLEAGRVLDMDFAPMSVLRDLNRTIAQPGVRSLQKLHKELPSHDMMRATVGEAVINLRGALKKANARTIHPEFGKLKGKHPFSSGDSPLKQLHMLGGKAQKFLRKHGYDSVFTRREGMRGNQGVMTVLGSHQIKPKFGK